MSGEDIELAEVSQRVLWARCNRLQLATAGLGQRRCRGRSRARLLSSGKKTLLTANPLPEESTACEVGAARKLQELPQRRTQLHSGAG
jgi:hypothetical protein